MAVTLKNIAERTGLATSTVSLILNRRPNDFSSAETRQKVFAVAEELGYKQKFGHKLLRGDKTNTAALLVAIREISVQEHIQQLLLLLLNQFEKRGYSLYVMTLEEDETKNLQTIDNLCARGTEKFLFIGDPVGGAAIREKLAQAQKRVVGYSSACPFSVATNPVPAIRKILNFFLENKRENFRMIAPERSLRVKGLYELFPETPQEELRERYFESLQGHNINWEIEKIAETGYMATKRLLAKEPDVSAIFYHSDYFAVGGIRCLFESGRVPGKDVLVAGVNDIYAIRNGIFPVSSIRHPLDEITDLLLDGIDGDEEGEFSVILHDIIRK